MCGSTPKSSSPVEPAVCNSIVLPDFRLKSAREEQGKSAHSFYIGIVKAAPGRDPSVYSMDCVQSSIIYGVKDEERINRLIPLWLKRPENKRTEKDLVIFYRWLEENHPDLLKRHNDDEFRQLKADLQGFIRAA